MGTNVVLLADPLLGPLHRDVAFLGEGFHPAVVIVGALTQDLFADGVDLVEVTEKVDDVLGAGEQGQMAEDDDTVETVVYECQQAAEQPREFFHRSSRFQVLELAPRAWDRGPVEVKSQWLRQRRAVEPQPGVFLARCRAGGAEISNIFG